MSRGLPATSDPLDTHTRPVAEASAAAAAERVIALTVLGHAQASRIGERAMLVALRVGEPVPLSRAAPAFSQPDGGAPRPLADPFLSRAPLVSITWRDDRAIVQREREGAIARVDGADLARSRVIDPEDLSRGVVLELGGRCVLLLHEVEAAREERPPRFDLVGDSDAMVRLRRDLARMAATSMRVLLRGETGSGKELVARAIHAASARSGGPYVAVNMGAVAPSLAASALFGHARGGFTGAAADHDGHFVAAHGGTLFLDEVGDTEASVQAMLLRALETGEVQRVGEKRVRKVDVRLISATDADLEAAVAEGRFREPLLHRIGELTLRVPPLRARRDDVGRLILCFLRELLTAEEQSRLLEGQLAERQWLSASAVARLARAPWTGNVRQLRNVVRQLVVLCREEAELALSPDIEATLGKVGTPPLSARAASEPEDILDSAVRALQAGKRQAASDDIASRRAGVESPPQERIKGKRPQDLTEEEILDALAKTGWKRTAAAELLGIGRSSLYAIIADNPRLSRSRDLTREEIREAFDRNGGDLARTAAELQLSEHGLKLRLQALGVLRLR